jgi:MFS family permease
MKKELDILLFASYLNTFGFGFFGPIYAIYVTNIGGTLIDTSLSWALYSLVMGVLIIYFGKIEDRTNKRLMVVIGYFMLAVGILSYAFVQNKAQLFLVQMFNGVGVAVLNPAFKALYAKNQDKGKETYEWSLWEGGERIMMATSAIVGGLIAALLSFKIMFYIMFSLHLVAALISLKLLDKSKR